MLKTETPIQCKEEQIYILPSGLIEYNYRATDGELYRCVVLTVEEAREKCAKWLLRK